jgi:hypothetical protein
MPTIRTPMLAAEVYSHSTQVLEDGAGSLLLLTVEV